jgi:hypothetical protein
VVSIRNIKVYGGVFIPVIANQKVVSIRNSVGVTTSNHKVIANQKVVSIRNKKTCPTVQNTSQTQKVDIPTWL